MYELNHDDVGMRPDNGLDIFDCAEGRGPDTSCRRCRRQVLRDTDAVRGRGLLHRRQRGQVRRSNRVVLRVSTCNQ